MRHTTRRPVRRPLSLDRLEDRLVPAGALIVVGSGPGIPALVRAFDAATGVEVRSFLPYGANFTGGVSVAAGDVNGDGRADIVPGAGPGGGPPVKGFDGP